MTFIYKLDLNSIFWRCTRRPKLNFLRQRFRKLSYYRQTDRQTGIHSDRQTDRQTDRLTDRHTYMHTDRQMQLKKSPRHYSRYNMMIGTLAFDRWAVAFGTVRKNQCTVTLHDRSTDWLIVCLIDWLIDWLINRSIDRSIDQLIDLFWCRMNFGKRCTSACGTALWVTHTACTNYST